MGRRYNLIGFSFNNVDTTTYKKCGIHPYKRLIPHKTDPNIAFCPECGSEYPLNVKDTITEQGIKSDIPAGSQSQTKIVQAKKKRKFRDSMGNPIPEDDKQAMADLASGKTVVYYENKIEDDAKDKVVSIGKYGKVRWSDLM
jgi:hypothetical protein